MKYLFSLFAFVLLFSCTSQNSSVKPPYSTIEYQAGACFGFCPIFKMTINSDRTAVLEAEHYNFSKSTSKDEISKEREGTFTTTIKESDYKKLVALLNDLNVKSLQDKYGSHNITDLSTAYLRIKFEDGASKNVEDYGKRGSEKLTQIYQFFEALKHNQEWTKVK